MPPLLLNIDNGSALDALVYEGIARYRRRLDLRWQVQHIPASGLWRVHETALNWPGPVAFAGLLRENTIDHLRREMEDRPAWYLSVSPVGQDNAWVVQVDDPLIGSQAVDHLLKQGYEHLAAWGHWTIPPRDKRFQGAQSRCIERGVVLHRVAIPPAAPSASRGEQEVLRELDRLPRPLGILTHQDADAAFLRTFCQAHGLRVPEEIGIVGVDDNVEVCEHVQPHLSSVRTPWRSMGERLARTFHRLLSGDDDIPRKQHIAPLGVTLRRSTALGFSATEDPIVRGFLRLVKQRSVRGLTVSQCARLLDVDRTTLFRHVAASTGRPPLDHIHDTRIAHACELLRHSGLTISEIARQSGYRSSQRLNAAFRKRFPVSPGLWREG